MSRYKKNVKKYENLSKNRKKLQNIAKNHPNIAKYFKKCQKMLTFILPTLPKPPIPTHQTPFLTQNQASTSNAFSKKLQNSLFFKNSRFQKSKTIKKKRVKPAFSWRYNGISPRPSSGPSHHPNLKYHYIQPQLKIKEKFINPKKSAIKKTPLFKRG